MEMVVFSITLDVQKSGSGNIRRVIPRKGQPGCRLHYYSDSPGWWTDSILVLYLRLSVFTPAGLRPINIEITKSLTRNSSARNDNVIKFWFASANYRLAQLICKCNEMLIMKHFKCQKNDCLQICWKNYFYKKDINI